jgi:hypothetical protein
VAVKAPGLGLFPVDVRGEMCAGERGTAVGESAQVEADREDEGKGRQTWGSLKSIVGKGGRWVSGGYWEKQGKEDKVFI